MREFILLSLKGFTGPSFNVDDLIKGRMELVCQTILNSLFVSKDIRRDTIVRVSLNGAGDPPKVVSFVGSEIKSLDPTEREVALILRKALSMKDGGVIEGVYVAKESFESLIKNKKLYYLHPSGKDIRGAGVSESCFVLGDYIGLPRKTEKLLLRLGAEKIKLGPKMLFAAHCPIIVHNELDRNSI
tara:strand:+ start:8557 stop:9114 length:558 start_codon:yes stop_codon:yes gene_type:complete